MAAKDLLRPVSIVAVIAKLSTTILGDDSLGDGSKVIGRR